VQESFGVNEYLVKTKLWSERISCEDQDARRSGEQRPVVSKSESSMASHAQRARAQLSLYTILSLPILYGVCHIKGGSGGGHIWRKSRAIVLL